MVTFGQFAWGTYQGNVRITEVAVDIYNDTIYISGRDFDFGGPLKVRLGEIGNITSLCTTDFLSTPQVIECVFSVEGLPPDGDYLLTVSTGHHRRHHQKKHDEYDLTIGAVGPAGPQGADGADGAQGIQGLTGLTGADGAQSIQGPEGPQGPAGSGTPQISFRATHDSDQNLPNSTVVKVEFTSVFHNHGGNYDQINSEYVAQEDGVYHFQAQVEFNSETNGARCILYLFVDGVSVKEVVYDTCGGPSQAVNLSTTIELSEGSVVDIRAWQNISPAHLDSSTTHSFSGGMYSGGADGADGAQGIQGPTGLTGPAGADGVSGYEQLEENHNIAINGILAEKIFCSAGKQPISGGWSFGSQFMRVIESRPQFIAGGGDWSFQIKNQSGALQNVTIFAVCALTP